MGSYSFLKVWTSFLFIKKSNNVQGDNLCTKNLPHNYNKYHVRLASTIYSEAVKIILVHKSVFFLLSSYDDLRVLEQICLLTEWLPQAGVRGHQE